MQCFASISSFERWEEKQLVYVDGEGSLLCVLCIKKRAIKQSGTMTDFILVLIHNRSKLFPS